ncbi:unnamed protein product [Caenorhabditis bovis]|uniref:Uncharacterized protein n=1 Tax=Caenorhabditis bovis TaxID=2654633 RepID=A0A8S1F587_9PELO|nr:unnamed protein product [Caenorhabditis bovis]
MLNEVSIGGENVKLLQSALPKIEKFAIVEHNDAILERLKAIQSSLIEEMTNLNALRDAAKQKEVEVQKEKETIVKEIAKDEKSLCESEALSAEIEQLIKQNCEKNEEFQNICAEIGDLEANLKELEETKRKIDDDTVEISRKIEEAEEKRKRREEDVEQSKLAELKAIEEAIQKIDELEEMSDEALDLFEMSPRVCELLNYLRLATEELAESLDGLWENETIESMEQKLKQAREETKAKNEELSIMTKIQNEISLIEQEIMIAKSEKENVDKTAKERKLQIERLKSYQKRKIDEIQRQAAHAAALISLHAAATNPELSQFVANSTTSMSGYKTPLAAAKAPMPLQRKNAGEKRQLSDESRFTPVLDESPYPGIKIMKIDVNEFKKRSFNSSEYVTSFDDSMNVSKSSLDSGSTQNGTMMGGMFSPLGNNKRKPDSEDEDAEDDQVLANFSMMDHFRNFEKKKQKQRGGDDFDDSEATPSPEDSVSQRFQPNIFLDVEEDDVSPISRTTMERSPDISALDGGEKDDLEISMDDADNSLLANNTDVDNDTSIWGSEF